MLEYEKLMNELNMKEKEEYYPDELFGGKVQRVVIILFVLKHAKILIADEPTTSLDNENAKLIFEIKKKI